MSPSSDYELSTNPARIDWPRVHAWLSSSYWSPNIPLERIQLGAANSALVIGAFHKPTGAQAAFARDVYQKSL
jgi:hypothetical protein